MPAHSDVPFLTALRTDGTVRQYLGGPLSHEAAVQRAHADVGAETTYVVSLRTTGVGIGLLKLSDEGHGGIELSYEFIPSAWGLGYATEAALAVTDWAQQVLHLDELLAATQTANASSRRLLGRLNAAPCKEFEEFGASQILYRFQIRSSRPS